MKIDKLLLVLLMISFVASCTTGITWNPDWYIGDYLNERIISEKGHTIQANNQEFNGYACIHIEQVIELKEILRKARIPKEYTSQIFQGLDVNKLERFKTQKVLNY